MKYEKYHRKLNVIARNKRDRKLVDKYHAEVIERLGAGESREVIKANIINREVATMGPLASLILGWLVRKFIELMIDYIFSEMKQDEII